MAEQNGNTPPHSQNAQAPGVDAMTAFWRDVWARSAAAMPNAGAAMPGFGAMPGMPGMPNMAGMDPAAAAAAFMSPEVLRRMQATFFDAMAQHAEQFMRSPQFLEAMKRSMDQALQFKRQMDDYLKSNLSNAFETVSGGANTEILSAIRQSSAQLQAHIDSRIDRLEARVARLEGGDDAAPTKPSTGTASTGTGKKTK